VSCNRGRGSPVTRHWFAIPAASVQFFARVVRHLTSREGTDMSDWASSRPKPPNYLVGPIDRLRHHRRRRLACGLRQLGLRSPWAGPGFRGRASYRAGGRFDRFRRPRRFAQRSSSFSIEPFTALAPTRWLNPSESLCVLVGDTQQSEGSPMLRDSKASTEFDEFAIAAWPRLCRAAQMLDRPVLWWPALAPPTRILRVLGSHDYPKPSRSVRIVSRAGSASGRERPSPNAWCRGRR
jgi:hypothetical protein